MTNVFVLGLVPNLVNSSRYGGLTMMADSFCALCAAYNWLDCLMRFCYSGFGGFNVGAYGTYGPGFNFGVASLYGLYYRPVTVGTRSLWKYS